jgi:hypothetical protein
VLWISHASRLLNLGSLAERRFLSGVRLIDCPLSETDMSILDTLPERVSVEIVTR